LCGSWAARVNNLDSDLSTTAMLRRLSTLMRDCEGTALDAGGTIRTLHPDAPATPIYWCFNGHLEFARLAEACGPDQPLVAMRSLNTVLAVTPETVFVSDALARHYAATLLARFGQRPCIIGGNCQAAHIAWRVAEQLRAAGVTIKRLVALDAEPRMPWPGSVRLLFGQDSIRYNPRLTVPAGGEVRLAWRWQRAARRFDSRTIPGGHGQYFRPENVAFTARAILDPDDITPALSPPSAEAICAARNLRWMIEHADAGGTTIRVEAGPDMRHLGGLAVVPLWRGTQGVQLGDPGHDWIMPVNSLPVWRHRFITPPGQWGAKPVMVRCLAGYGPLE
jgi:hypothetical protein